MDQNYWNFNFIETKYQPARINELKPLNGDEKGAADLNALKAALSTWVTQMDSWLYIYGGYGTGKTHCLRALKNRLANLIIVVSAEDFQEKLFSKLAGREVDQFLHMLKVVPVLAIDDWGIEHSVSFTTDALASIINFRYNLDPARFPVIFTSNMSPLDIASSGTVAQKRILSRLVDNQSAQVFQLRQPDFRTLGVLHE